MWLFLLTVAFGQTPTVTIRDSDPLSDGRAIVATRDTDVTMDCYVENLPVETTVSRNRLWVKCRLANMLQISNM